MLVLAGLEPTGRAGLLADVAAVQGQGAAAVGVATAITAQGFSTFRAHALPRALVEAQVIAALEQSAVHAVKVGMAPDASALLLVRRLLPDVPWVVDPVVRTSRGQRLSTLRPSDYLRLAGPNVTICPNVDEAAWLLGDPRSRPDPAWAEGAARRLLELGFGAAVVKGGHLKGSAVDVVAEARGVARLDGARLRRGAWVRGTGCRFASALAAGLAQGKSVPAAALIAKRAVAQYLRKGSSRA